MGELLKGEPLFPERTEAGVVAAVAALLGSPSERIWPVGAGGRGGGAGREGTGRGWAGRGEGERRCATPP